MNLSWKNILLGGSLLFLFFLLFALFLTTSQVQKTEERQEIRTRAAPATNLSFSPATLTTILNQTFTLDIMLNTDANRVTASAIQINYDKTKLEAKRLWVNQGDLLPEEDLLPRNIDNQAGKATIILGSGPIIPQQREGRLATIEFRAIALTGTSPSNVSLDMTQAAAVNESGNVVRQSSPAIITIATLTPTLIPTPTPTRTPTSTPTPRPTPTPTPISGEYFTVRVGNESFVFYTTNQRTIQDARQAYYQGLSLFPNGKLLRGKESYNNQWSWHYDYQDVEIVSASIELCDGVPSDVENNLDYWLRIVRRFCPWSGRIVGIGLSSLSFQIKFQGIDTQRPNKMVSLTLKQANQERYRFENVVIAADQNGIYTGRVTNIAPGTYDLYLKGWTHLQKKFANVTLNLGNNNRDFAGVILKTGDVIDNNRIDIYDYNKVVEHFGPRRPAGGSPADFDLDGDVDIFDYNYLVGNFGQSGD